MSHIGSRRHRLNEDETPHVYRLVRDRLQQLLKDHYKPQIAQEAQNRVTANLPNNKITNVENFHAGKTRDVIGNIPPNLEGSDEDEGCVYGEALSLFRLLWRMDHNYPGRPEYPEPATWSTLESYLTGNIVLPVVNGPYREAGA